MKLLYDIGLYLLVFALIVMCSLVVVHIQYEWRQDTISEGIDP